MALLTGAASWLSLDLAAQLRAHIALLLAAGLLWAASLALLDAEPRAPEPARPRLIAWIFLVALCLRLPGWLLPPRHSDDVYRYLWDGAVARAGLDPYGGPPLDGRYAALRADPAAGALAARVNHPQLPTIYPPAAQLAFRLAPDLRAWRLLVAIGDGAIICLLLHLCRRRGLDPRWACAWAWSPLCAVELAQSAHMDVLAIAPLLGAVALLRRPALAGALVAAATLAKPLGAAVLPAALRGPGRRRFALGAAAGAAALLLPFWRSGAGVLGSLGEYGRRWRGNDGAFALLQGAIELVVDRLYRPPRFPPWEPWRWPRLARLVTGRARDTVFPDELAAFLARGITLTLLAGLALWLLRRRPSSAPQRGPVAAAPGGEADPGASALVLVLAYLLLTPVLHPWYALFALALCPLCPALAPPAIALALLAPLAYLPLGGWLSGGAWVEPAWTRALEHGAAWLLLLRSLPMALITPRGGPRI